MVSSTTNRRPRPLVKAVVALTVLAVLGFLFVRSVRSTRSAPYSVDRAHLLKWTVVVNPQSGLRGSGITGPMLALRPGPELVMGLSRQVFTRGMESLSSPEVPAIPLVLQDEFDRAFAGHVTADQLAEAARAAGLESSPIEPRCLAYRRVSDPGLTRQLYFVIFDAPAFGRFREQIARLVSSVPSGSSFDPVALSPVLFVSASDSAFNRWLPIRAAPKSDCVAPITTS